MVHSVIPQSQMADAVASITPINHVRSLRDPTDLLPTEIWTRILSLSLAHWHAARIRIYQGSLESKPHDPSLPGHRSTMSVRVPRVMHRYMGHQRTPGGWLYLPDKLHRTRGSLQTHRSNPVLCAGQRGHRSLRRHALAMLPARISSTSRMANRRSGTEASRPCTR